MTDRMYDFPRRLKNLREKLGYTQSELAKRLSITRASVNAWEMGIAAPSTKAVIELAELFGVTSDYLLGLDAELTISTAALTEREISALLNTVAAFNESKQKEL